MATQINKSNLLKIANALVSQCKASRSDAMKAAWAFIKKVEGNLVREFASICKQLFPGEAPVTRLAECQAEYIRRNQETITEDWTIRPFIAIEKETEKAICFKMNVLWMKGSGKKTVETTVWFPKSQIVKLTGEYVQVSESFLDVKAKELMERNLYI